eukprot:9161534-Lingulodinium_polyedra.AAC.1
MLCFVTCSFLCRELHIAEYENYSYVGAPWGVSARTCEIANHAMQWQSSAIDAGLEPPLSEFRA